jgi:hypothetical protein
MITNEKLAREIPYPLWISGFSQGKVAALPAETGRRPGMGLVARSDNAGQQLV